MDRIGQNGGGAWHLNHHIISEISPTRKGKLPYRDFGLVLGILNL